MKLIGRSNWTTRGAFLIAAGFLCSAHPAAADELSMTFGDQLAEVAEATTESASSVATAATEEPTLSAGMSKLFHLRNGNLFEGTIVDISGEGAVTLETADGTLSIPASDFLVETADISKTNGTVYRGEILAEDPLSFSLLTEYGEIVVNKSDIRTMSRFLAGRRSPQ